MIDPSDNAQRTEKWLQEATLSIFLEALEIFTTKAVDDALRHVMEHVKDLVKCRYAAIRIIDEYQNIPFYIHDLDPGFHEKESWLTINDCMCGRVARGDVDPSLPFFTEAGSFFSNSTTELLASASEAEKGETRNTCNMMGYESVGIFPVRASGHIIGELYLSDYDRNVFSPDVVAGVETICDRIGVLLEAVIRHLALEESREQLEHVLDSVSDGIVSHDLNRRIFVFNKAAERITGYRSEEVIGRDCHDIFPGGLCGGACDFHDESDMQAQPLNVSTDIRTKSGERRRVEMSRKTIEGQTDNPMGVMLSFRDLSREFDLERRLEKIEQFAGIIGRDKKMLEVFDLIRDLSESNAPVLIQGESGTGKELVAAAIHRESLRANRLFVPVNCGALPDGLIESELFGHVRGAFTGAIRDKKGRFELADNGTIFLDEVGELSQAIQVKLLRVLQEGTFERVGGEKTLKVDVRIISATNKDLSREVAAGRFRRDLYYRLCVVHMNLPPLRERRNDIPLLIGHFLKHEAQERGKDKVVLAPEALGAMLDHMWPGNVRELQNALQFALIKCRGDVVGPEHLPPAIIASAPTRPTPHKRRRKRKLDVSQVHRALADAGGNKVKAAKLLGVSRATLYRFLAAPDVSQDM